MKFNKVIQLYQQEDEVVELWEKRFNRVMDMTNTSSVELFYITEVRYEFSDLHMERFTSLHFTSLHFTSLHFTSLHFTSLHFTSLHFTSLHFTSLHFTSLLHFFTVSQATILSYHQEKMRGQRGTLRALAGICRFH